MSRASKFFTGLIVTLIGHACLAQEPPTAGPAASQPEKSKQNLRTFRPEDPNFLVERMTKELNLDEAQQKAMTKVLTDHYAYMMELRQSMQQQPNEGYEKMKAISDEMRTAREGGDAEKVRLLSEQLRQLGQEQQARMAPMRQKLTESQEKLRGDLSAVLRDDQKEGFTKFWDERMARRSPYKGVERSPQTLKTLVDRLPGLTTQQNEQIELLFRQHQEAEKTATKGSPAERALVTKLYDGVIALLTPEQRSRLESQLAGRRGGARGVEPITPRGGQVSPPTPTTPEQPATP